MKLLARICTPLLAAGLGLLALPAPAAHATHGCTDAMFRELAANPYDPTPTVTIFPPAVDTAPTVDYVLYDVTAVNNGIACVLQCWSDAAFAIQANPNDPTPAVTILPPAVDTAPTFGYVIYDAQAVGRAMYCTGYHDIA